MPTDEFQEYVTSPYDFYALLSLDPSATPKDVQRSYRLASLKSHPDKNPDDPLAASNFHLLGIAKGILSTPALKEQYDNLRAAKLQKQRQNELFDKKRRTMKENLEAREGRAGGKRNRTDSEDESERRAMEIRRLAEDGKRRRKEMAEAVRKAEAEAEELEKRRRDDTEGISAKKSSTRTADPKSGGAGDAEAAPLAADFEASILEKMMKADG
ncbi:MAG: hypothetical protein M1824_003632 [Vezdaea acicularis]|nr:MAG: hypothetical protein M1824_003632 [Vezdaea acicularis]